MAYEHLIKLCALCSRFAQDLALYRYLGQLLDAEDAISSIRKGVDVLQQQIATLVRLLHHLHTQVSTKADSQCSLVLHSTI